MPRHKRNKLALSLTALAIATVVTLGQRFGWLQNNPASQTLQAVVPGTYAIDHFIDGDTIAVNMSGMVEKVRFIGVDALETHKPNTPVQCFGEEATARTKQLIGSQRVRLEADSKSTDRDRYNRLLRYVYLPDGTDINETLVQGGYGFYYPYLLFGKSAQFATDEQQAQAQHRGLWNVCRPTPTDDGGYTLNNV